MKMVDVGIIQCLSIFLAGISRLRFGNFILLVVGILFTASQILTMSRYPKRHIILGMVLIFDEGDMLV